MCTDFFLLGKLQPNKTSPEAKAGKHTYILTCGRGRRHLPPPSFTPAPAQPRKSTAVPGLLSSSSTTVPTKNGCSPQLFLSASSEVKPGCVTSLLEMPRSLGANSCLLEKSGHPWAVDSPGSPILTARSDTGGERNALGMANEQAHPTHIYHTACLGWSQTLTLFCE